MSQVDARTTTTPIVVGVPTQLAPPNPSANVGAVVLQNLSGYQLTVTFAGNTYTLPPYMSDIYEPTQIGGPVVVLAADLFNSPASVPAIVNAVWYGPGDVPDAAYPAPISAPAYALGLAIATQLLNNGVPSVIVEKVVYNAGLAAGASVDVDVSQYASATIYFSGTAAAAPSAITVQQFDPTKAIAVAAERFANPQGFGTSDIPPVVVELVGAVLRITNTAAGDNFLRIVASNRPARRRFDVRANANAIDSWNLASAAYGTGAQPLTQSDPTVHLHGRVTMRVRLTGATAARGFLQLSDSFGSVFIPADTTEMVASAGGLQVVKDVYLPAGYNSLSFTFTTAGTTGVNVTMVPDPNG